MAIKSPLVAQAGIQLLISREDLNHPWASGNKWWKLRHNIDRALRENKQAVLTYGGAWSNHIRATAAVARHNGLKSIGIIRGERPTKINSALSFAESKGMILKFVSREAYRQKHTDAFLYDIRNQFGDFYEIPEGGSNAEGFKGCVEWGELLRQEEVDHIAVACGTGTTAAGIIAGLDGIKSFLGVSVLKGEFMKETITRILLEQTNRQFMGWSVEDRFHFGGYAKSTPELVRFIQDFRTQFQIPIEPVYTGKLMYGLFELIREGKFERGSTVMALHTGGVFE